MERVRAWCIIRRKTKNHTFCAGDSVSSPRSNVRGSLKVFHSGHLGVRYSSHGVESRSRRRYQKSGIDARFPSSQRNWKRSDHPAPTAERDPGTSIQKST